jgi:hypothetical protein
MSLKLWHATVKHQKSLGKTAIKTFESAGFSRVGHVSANKLNFNLGLTSKH